MAISPADLTVTARSKTKIYGQTVAFVGTEFTSSGLLNGDSVSSVTLTSSGAAAASAVAGSPYSIAPSAAAGTGLGNYTISYVNGTLTVSPANLTITASNSTKTYGQAISFAGTEFTDAGLLNSDSVTSVTLTSSGAAATATVAGSPYAIVPSAAVGGGLANYTIAYINGILTLNQATLAIAWTNPPPITYGAALGSNQLNATVTVPGKFTYSPGIGSVLDAGTNTLSVLFIPENTADYSNSIATVTLVVSNAPLTVIAADADRVYGQANPPLTGEITGLTNNDNINATYIATAGLSAEPETYAIVPVLVDPENRQTNYNVTLINGVLTVAVATPTVLWTNPASITYGAALGSNQLNAAANVPGDFAYYPTNGTVLNTGSNALSATFTPNDAVDYNSVTDMVSLSVLPATLTVTASSFSRPYGAANPVFTGTITGVTNGDDITAVYNCTETSSSPVGTYPIVASLVDPNNRQTNYAVNLVNGILVVGHPPQTLTWTNPAPITYGITLNANQLNALANIPGAYIYDPTNGTALTSGTNTLSVIFTPDDAVNYTSRLLKSDGFIEHLFDRGV